MLRTQAVPAAVEHAPPGDEPGPAALAALAGAVDRVAAGFGAESVDDLRALCAQHPRWAIARAYLATALLDATQVEEAREAIEEAVALAPGSFVVQLRYGEFLARTGFYDLAAAALGQALHLPAPDMGARDAAVALRTFCLQRARGMFYRRTPDFRATLQPLLSRIRRPLAALPLTANR